MSRATEEMYRAARETWPEPWQNYNLRDALRAALDAALAVSVSLHPVAWRMKREMGGYTYSTEKPDGGGMFNPHRSPPRNPQPEPLYASAPPLEALAKALEPFAGEYLPSNKRDIIDYDRYGLRRLMSPMEIARRDAFFALHPDEHPLAKQASRASLVSQEAGE